MYQKCKKKQKKQYYKKEMHRNKFERNVFWNVKISYNYNPYEAHLRLETEQSLLVVTSEDGEHGSCSYTFEANLFFYCYFWYIQPNVSKVYADL